MSYCRWSTDDFQCDVYVFEHVNGGWTTMIASRKRVLPEGVSFPTPIVYPGPDADEAAVLAWATEYTARSQKVSKLLDQATMVDIDLPEAGETFSDPTPGACADRLEALREIGYRVPQSAIDRLRGEHEPYVAWIAARDDEPVPEGGDRVMLLKARAERGEPISPNDALFLVSFGHEMQHEHWHRELRPRPQGTRRERMSDGVVVTWLGGNCPVQAEGTFDGVPFYFRARGASVTCDVGQWTWMGPTYEWPDAGWISEDTARAFIDEAYRRWHNRESPQAKSDAEYRRRNGLDSERMQALKWAGTLENAIGDEARPARDWLVRYAQEITERMKDPSLTGDD